MAKEGNQTILWCVLCNKPFNKESTLKRHGYYCRSRKSNDLDVRSRSCLACAKAKVRCDNKLPNCTRCMIKGSTCHVPGRNSSTTMASKSTSESTQREPPPSGAATSVVIFDKNVSMERDVLVDIDTNNIGEGQFDWDMTHVGKSQTGVSEYQDYQSHPPACTSLSSPDQGLFPSDHGLCTAIRSSNQSPSIPTMPNYELRFFNHRPAVGGGAYTTAMLMVRMLTSYPLMMRDIKSPPPFIHSYSLSDTNKSMESIITCASLMQMLEINRQGGRKLLWKNVRFECERLAAESTGFNKWELLSSMQALLIYMLLRLQEGETVYNNMDTLLLSTVWIVVCGLNHKLHIIGCGLPVPYGLSYGYTHEDWIFEESRRRLTITFKTVDMLFFIDPIAGCVRDNCYLFSPLPARKQLWEARDESEWMLEMNREIGGPEGYGLKVNGQMVKLKGYTALMEGNEIPTAQPQEPSEGESSANWQEWCSGMDGLGGLVMLAASLPYQI
ncbi:hypothetical protein GQ44DRAFT_702664 [Phaeosphaeriaceae sp. PMI808]|nr:hypothetical protein GQ44DRAFT_702664 [Phaeosphaeriaceae sp. PMI808]